jgi:hypothetical protein
MELRMNFEFRGQAVCDVTEYVITYRLTYGTGILFLFLS